MSCSRALHPLCQVGADLPPGERGEAACAALMLFISGATSAARRLLAFPSEAIGPLESSCSLSGGGNVANSEGQAACTAAEGCARGDAACRRALDSPVCRPLPNRGERRSCERCGVAPLAPGVDRPSSPAACRAGSGAAAQTSTLSSGVGRVTPDGRAASGPGCTLVAN